MDHPRTLGMKWTGELLVCRKLPFGTCCFQRVAHTRSTTFQVRPMQANLKASLGLCKQPNRTSKLEEPACFEFSR